MKAKQHFRHIAIAADQLLNTVLGGHADETLSSRIWRKNQTAEPKRRWKAALFIVDKVLFRWQHDHCLNSYRMELTRGHFPPDMKQEG
ncbi:hypothetical protein [Bergeriella denitrificans]|uniref:Uncharacterized protein n=1 Tax=Bergeriella denitrificans TaxID=494 RepID=A0A378UI31_BERDE|nr:hypothetical protein [Bergeriella denitrificans]STZ76349.1 Uncharacterised protein [Bergeriella denitrificans]